MSRKRVGGVATIPGRERALSEMVASIVGQLDELLIYSNSGVGEWPADAGKFWGVRHGVIYYALDDDIIYPPDFCDRMQEALDRHSGNGRALVTTHGRDYTGVTSVNGYYHGTYTARYHGLREVEADAVVHVPGSGSSVFYGEHLLDNYIDGRQMLKRRNPEVNMADLHLARWAKLAQMKCICVAHADGWLQHSPHVAVSDTIWSWEHESDDRQTEYLNRYIL